MIDDLTQLSTDELRAKLKRLHVLKHSGIANTNSKRIRKAIDDTEAELRARGEKIPL